MAKFCDWNYGFPASGVHPPCYTEQSVHCNEQGTWRLRSGVSELRVDAVLPHSGEGGSVRVDHPPEPRPFHRASNWNFDKSACYLPRRTIFFVSDLICLAAFKRNKWIYCKKKFFKNIPLIFQMISLVLGSVGPAVHTVPIELSVPKLLTKKLM